MEYVREFFYFKTIKLVSIHSLKIGIFHRIFQILVLVYIFVYAVWLNNGYKEYSPISGAVFTKVKGVGYVNNSIGGYRVFDAVDLIAPATENDALFITTAFVHTYQQRGICMSDINCTNSAGCINASSDFGELLFPPNCSSNYCMMTGWCPLEIDNITTIEYIQSLDDMSIFLRSSVNYNSFGIIKSDSPLPIKGRNNFFLPQLISNYQSTCINGCIIATEIDWTCYMDKDTCSPQITFRLLPGGFNYRLAIYDIDQMSRNLYKLYGVRMVIRIVGEGSRFSVFQTIITIGSSAALFSVATIFVDMILATCWAKKDDYDHKKYDHLQSEVPLEKQVDRETHD